MIAELPLVGAGGEPVDFRRTLASHGVASLPPSRIDEEAWTLEVTLPIPRGARTVRVVASANASAGVAVVGTVGARGRDALLAQLRHMFRLDEDLSPFYVVARDDPQLTWAAGRRRPNASQPDRLRGRRQDDLHHELRLERDRADGHGTRRQPRRRSRPAAAARFRAPTRWRRPATTSTATSRARATAARTSARSQTTSRRARSTSRSLNDPELPVDEIEARLLALPGVGPYAAAHVMLTSLGRYSRLVLDSWTRPTYAKLTGRKAADKTIERKFRRYGDFAGLAFWLLLTRGWVPDEPALSLWLSATS